MSNEQLHTSEHMVEGCNVNAVLNLKEEVSKSIGAFKKQLQHATDTMLEQLRLKDEEIKKLRAQLAKYEAAESALLKQQLQAGSSSKKREPLAPIECDDCSNINALNNISPIAKQNATSQAAVSPVVKRKHLLELLLESTLLSFEKALKETPIRMFTNNCYCDKLIAVDYCCRGDMCRSASWKMRSIQV